MKREIQIEEKRSFRAPFQSGVSERVENVVLKPVLWCSSFDSRSAVQHLSRRDFEQGEAVGGDGCLE